MKRYHYLLALTLLFSCNKKSGKEETKDSAMTVLNDTISATRKVVSDVAVASYSENVKDKDNLNDWKFAGLSREAILNKVQKNNMGKCCGLLYSSSTIRHVTHSSSLRYVYKFIDDRNKL